MGIKCRVHLQIQSSNKFAMKISQAEFSKVNDVLSAGPSSSSSSGSYVENNWRELQLPSFQPMPQESADILAVPTMFQVTEGGAVESLVLSKTEPEWSVNFKKALVVVFQTKSREGSSLESNTVSILR